MYPRKNRVIHFADMNYLSANKPFEGGGNQTARRRYLNFTAQAIQGLPEKYREVVELYYLQGKNMPRIAHDLGVHKSTVSRRLSAALRQLRGIAEICEKSGLFPP